MGNDFKMSALERPPDGSNRRRRGNRSAILLVCAGGLTIAAAFAGMILSAPMTAPGGQIRAWGAMLYVLLGLMSVSLVLSSVAIARSAPADRSAGQMRRGTRRSWRILAVLIAIHVSGAFFVLKQGPMIHIDTFTFQRDAAKSLLQGVDPYGGTQADIYSPYRTAIYYGPGMVVGGRVQVGFPYTPLTLLWVLPGYMSGDVRFCFVAAVVVAALFLFAIRPDTQGLCLVSALLFSPLTFSVERMSWTEPLVLLMLSATVYAAVKRSRWLPLALGLFLATKQYNVLALPLIGIFIVPFRWKAYWRLIGLSTAVAVATALPFAAWNIQGLWHDLILFQLAQPFRADSLSFAVAFPLIMLIGPVILPAFIAWLVRAGKRNSALFAAAYGSALLLFVFTSKQAFANYYFLIGQSFFLAAAAQISPSVGSAGAKPEATPIGPAARR